MVLLTAFDKAQLGAFEMSFPPKYNTELTQLGFVFSVGTVIITSSQLHAKQCNKC